LATARNRRRRRPVLLARRSAMLRFLLILVVIAIGSDAVINNGAYTQAAWREITSYTVKIENPSGSDPKLQVEKRT
jgi:hypothetical protein